MEDVEREFLGIVKRTSSQLCASVCVSPPVFISFIASAILMRGRVQVVGCGSAPIDHLNIALVGMGMDMGMLLGLRPCCCGLVANFVIRPLALYSGSRVVVPQ